MTIRCTRPYYRRFIETYMNFLVSACSYQELEVVRTRAS